MEELDKQFAKLAQSFGMKVLYHDTFRLDEEKEKELKCKNMLSLMSYWKILM